MTMTARPARTPRPARGLRVIQGRNLRTPVVTPWVAFTAVVVVAFLGLVMARTALDRGAFELAELDRQIAVEQTRHQQLLLEVATLESPARVGPLAAEMGLVYPEERQPLVVRGVVGPEPGMDPRWAGLGGYAAGSPVVPQSSYEGEPDTGGSG